MISWSTTAELSTVANVKIIAYALAGVGKTMLCATAPSPVIISAEGGTLSLSPSNIEKVYGKGQPDIAYDIPVLSITSVADLMEIYNWLKDPATKQQYGFKTVCLDSLSEIAEVFLASGKAQHKDPRKAYGELLDHMAQVVRDFRDLPYHIYMTAKQEDSKDQTGAVKANVAMPGSKLGPNIPYFFDEVFYLGIAEAEGKTYRYFQTDGDYQHVCKDRSGQLDAIERPHLTYIINKILGGNNVS